MHDRPTVLIQLGDSHIGADWVELDPRKTLAATIDAVVALKLDVAAVLALGDFAEHGEDAEYDQARAALARLGAPIYPAMGNHDARETLRRQFGLSGSGPVHYAIDLDPIRLIVLDTTIPGRDEGRLDTEALAWLERELSEHPQTQTLLAMHHPPLLTGSRLWDDIALAVESQTALSEICARHPQVCRILGAHLHRPLATEFASRPLLVAASTYVQFPFDPTATSLVASAEPPGFVVHVVHGDGRLLSSFQTVP